MTDIALVRMLEERDAEIARLRSESVLLRREIDLIRSLVYQHEDTAALKDTKP